MNEKTSPKPVTPVASSPVLPLLLILFFGSGCAALIYEIVWLQLLQLIIGSTAKSMGVLLGTYMAGLCIGSLLLPRLISKRAHPLRVYAALEIGIGAMGLLIIFYMKYVEGLYTGWATENAAMGSLFRALVSAMCLLPPTIMMGATLPAIARYVKSTAEGVSWLGFFYGGNIVGAVVGSLLAGFYLLRLYDMRIGTFVAVGLNALVSIIALVVAANAEYRADDSSDEQVDPAAPPAPGHGNIYLAIALSGLTGLGAEVVWTRLLSLMLGITTYTVSIILAVFLFGLGIGSTAGSVIARGSRRPSVALGVCQFLLAAAIGWSAYAIATLPTWPINLDFAEKLVDGRWVSTPWIVFQLDLVRALYAILPAAILWGASFPLALAAAARQNQDSGRLVGRVYAANTVGAIVGALAFSLLIIPHFGTTNSERALIVLACVSAMVALYPHRDSAADYDPERFTARLIIFGTSAFIVVAVGVILAMTVSDVPWTAVAFGRNSATWMGQCYPEIIPENQVPLNASPKPGDSKYDNAYQRFCTYVGEGTNVSVAVTMDRNGLRYFHGAGKVQASSDPHDMRLQRMLGHLSALIQGNPNDVLVVACGAGVTAGTFVTYPTDVVKHITICDIEEIVPRDVAPMFAKENYGIVGGTGVKADPRTRVVIDDGRHFIRTANQKYDIITSDPIDPWVKGCAALNTVEYYQMAKDHLKPGGVMSLWIPFYEENIDGAKSILSTFFKVFPNGILFSNDGHDNNGLWGFDAVLFGINDPTGSDSTPIDIDAIEAKLASPEYAAVTKSIEDAGFGRPDFNRLSVTPNMSMMKYPPGISLLATYAGQARDLKAWSEAEPRAQINDDMNLRLQYLAGMWLNSPANAATEILLGYQANDGVGILDTRYFRFPDERFPGSPDHVAQLKEAMYQLFRPVDLQPPAAPPASAPAVPSAAEPAAATTAPATP
jgi:spermidine synthase